MSNTLQDKIDMTQGLDLIGVFAKGSKDGQELDHFRLSLEPQYEYLRPLFETLYNDPMTKTMRRIHGVKVLAGDGVRGFTYYNEQYDDNTGRMLHRCHEGQRIKFRDDTGQLRRGRIPCLRETTGCACKVRGRLHARLEAIEMRSGIIGRYLFTTGSYNDVRHIGARLRDIEAVVESYDVPLSNVLWNIERIPDTIDVPDGNGGFGQANHYMVRLTPDQSYMQETIQANARPESIGAMQNLGSYMPYLQLEFANVLPDYSPHDVATYHGKSLDDFLETYPLLSDVKLLIQDWLIASGVPVGVKSIRCIRVNGRYRYLIDYGFGVVTMYKTSTMRPYVDVSPFRRIVGAYYEPTRPLRIILGRNKTNTNLKVLSVVD